MNADGSETEAARAWVDGTPESTGSWMVSYRDTAPVAAGRAHRLAQDPNPGETIIYYAWAYAPAGKLAQPPA